MVLCNIVITQVALKNYVVNLQGRKHVKICSINYVETDAGAVINKLISIRSNMLRFPYGNYNNIVFTNNISKQVTNMVSDITLICDFNGSIDIELVDILGNVPIANFQGMTLLLDITDIENPDLPEQHYKHKK